MDDPLSAVDPAVGRELFSKVVCGRLNGSTRVLVTHQVTAQAGRACRLHRVELGLAFVT